MTDFCGKGQAFVGPEPCLSGDRLGSGMERPRFRSSPYHLVASYSWASHLTSVMPHLLIWKMGLTLPASLGGGEDQTRQKRSWPVKSKAQFCS